MNRLIQVRKENRFIKVTFPYNPQLVEKIKIIQGRRWNHGYFDRVGNGKIKISTPVADIIPKWKYIRTPGADMNELYAIRKPALTERRP
ncbi:MAG: hypothetical protein ACP5QK_06615 [Myxococcota bacterium]